jgi:hypothetical protein
MNAEITAPILTFGTSWRGCHLVLINGYWRIVIPVHPVEALAQEVEKAIDAGLNYLALLLTLTLPDICAALEAQDGRPNERQRDVYQRWYKRNIFDRIGGLKPEEAWELRCTVVHQGRSDASDKRAYDRIIFTMPQTRVGEATFALDSLVINGAMTFHVPLFCGRWLNEVRTWIERTASNTTVQRNLPLLLQVRPNGLPPYIEGAAIIA